MAQWPHKEAILNIERVQKVAVKIILSDSETGLCEFSYQMALVILELEPPEDRRERLCKTFAKKTLKSRHAQMFQLKNNPYNTRSKPEYVAPKCNTNRFYNSPLNYMTRLLNNEN